MFTGLATFVFDFVVRQKMGGLNLSFYLVSQFPVIEPRAYNIPTLWQNSQILASEWFFPRTLELNYTAWDMAPFAEDFGWFGPPFFWDEERRFLLLCELDAAFFHLYLPAEKNGQWQPAEKESAEDMARLKAAFPTPRHALDYILDTFPIVRRKDEAKYDGDYRTKRVILEIYDVMQQAMRTGQPYQTRLDPPPGPPADAQGNFIQPADWTPEIRAKYNGIIHPPKEKTG